MNNTAPTPRTSRLFRAQTGSLQELRQNVLQSISWLIIVAGIILLIISVPDDFAAGNYTNLIIDLGGFGTLLILTILQKQVSFTVRAITLVSVTFSQGVVDYLNAGLLGDSRIWILFSIIFTTILLGFRAGLIANGLSILFVLAGAGLISTGMMELGDASFQALSTKPGIWLDLLPIFILSSLFLTFTIGSIIRGLEQNQETLSKAYNETQSLTEQLENEQIQLQTQAAALERRNRYIEAAAEVGKTATSIMEIGELLNRVVELISEQFGFYQAGIFFVDEQGENAILQAASSDGGKRMLARGHSLKVGEQGIVGYVTSTGLPRIALDVGDDAVHFNTPELPQTRSEMALPLFVGGRVFGALDVQSVEESAFTEDDVSALTVLADQVSMAINNARLFSDLQTRIDSERQAYGEFSREAWRNLVRHTGRMEYKFSDNQLTTPDEAWPEEMEQALKLQEPVISVKQDRSLSIPLTISGLTVGAIRVQKKTALDWNNDEIDLIKTLTERLSQALESARLYRSSQQQAMQEQLTASISARLRQTLDIDTVLKTAAKELGDAFNAKEVVIRMAANEPGN